MDSRFTTIAKVRRDLLAGKEMTSFKGFVKYQTTDLHATLCYLRKQGLQMCSEYRTSFLGKRYKVWRVTPEQAREYLNAHPHYEKYC